MIDVSVIIVNWNTRQLLLDCIQSLIDTTFSKKLEIIVVDNGSTDDSVIAVKEKYPQVNVICNPQNDGFAKANNIGIKSCHGRNICLVNSDVKANLGLIDNLCDYLDQNPQTGAVAPRTLNADQSIQTNCREFPSLRNSITEAFFLNRIFPGIQIFRGREMASFTYDSTQEVETIPGCVFMIPRSISEIVGLLDESFYFYGEDIDWCKRIISAGYKVVFAHEACAYHYQGSSSVVAPLKFQIEMLKSRLLFWKKHHPMWQYVIFGWILSLHISVRVIVWTLVLIFNPHKIKESRNRIYNYSKQLYWLLLEKKVPYSSIERQVCR